MRQARLQLGRQVGVRQQWPAHGDESARPSARIFSARDRIVNSADGDHRHVDHLLDRGRGANVEFIAVVGGIDHPGDQPIDHASADVERVRAGGHEFGVLPGRFRRSAGLRRPVRTRRCAA